MHITPHETRLIYIPEKNALVHPISFWHRYALKYRAQTPRGLIEVKKIFPNAMIWCGFNFRYLLFTCEPAEQKKLMETARFEVLPLPQKEDIKIWLEDENGWVRDITDLQYAKKVPIIKLKSNMRQ